MKRRILSLLLLLLPLAVAAQRQAIWPDGRMPHASERQVAAMTTETKSPGFDSTQHRMPYLEWFAAPERPNGCCMILISGGSYKNCCDGKLIDKWNRELTALGIQCVNFVYRTPRPVGIPYYQTAWEDGQRAVRLVRSQAAERGFDPEKIGVIGMSAGGHLALLLATASQTAAYSRVDALDDLPCHINWAIVNAPAYMTTDADELGIPAARDGYGADVGLSPIFPFDAKTCPVCLHHGGADIYSPNGSTLVYRRLREIGVPAELHIYPGKGHGAYGFERAVEFMTQMGFLGPVAPEEPVLERFASDPEGVRYEKESIWPEGKMPNPQPHQCEPYLEWYIPEKLSTHAIQIIYSGGGYNGNGPESFEVAPPRRFLNALGIPVVALKYRTPRPQAPLAKHTSAWQDLQRTIRIVRSEAALRGLDPDRIGIMGSSAGGHLTLMGVTSSLHQAYRPIDAIDKLPCNVQWGIAIYPAYVLSDGADWHNTTGGNSDDAIIVPDFSFDMASAPMLMIHGDSDYWSPMGSVKVWEKMRSMGIQCELHTLALRPHCFQRIASPGTGSYYWLDRIREYLETQGFLRD